VFQLAIIDDVDDFLIGVLVAFVDTVAFGDRDAENANLLSRQIDTINFLGAANTRGQILFNRIHGGLIVRMFHENIHVLEIRHEHGVTVLSRTQHFLRNTFFRTKCFHIAQRGLKSGGHGLELAHTISRSQISRVHIRHLDFAIDVGHRDSLRGAESSIEHLGRGRFQLIVGNTDHDSAGKRRITADDLKSRRGDLQFHRVCHLLEIPGRRVAKNKRPERFSVRRGCAGQQ